MKDADTRETGTRRGRNSRYVELGAAGSSAAKDRRNGGPWEAVRAGGSAVQRGGAAQHRPGDAVQDRVDPAPGWDSFAAWDAAQSADRRGVPVFF